jgi:hypothetical protein
MADRGGRLGYQTMATKPWCETNFGIQVKEALLDGLQDHQNWVGPGSGKLHFLEKTLPPASEVRRFYPGHCESPIHVIFLDGPL